MAPEILFPPNTRTAKTTPATDVYAFSILAWEFLSGRRPWLQEYGADAAAPEFTAWLKREAAMRNTRPDLRSLPAGLPAPIVDIIARGWAPLPATRPTFAEIAAAFAAVAPSPVPHLLVSAPAPAPAPKAVAPAPSPAPAPTPASAPAPAPASAPASAPAPAPAPTPADDAASVLTTISRFRHTPRKAADTNANVDICIVMDVTQSMSSFIVEAKARAKEIVENIRDNDASGKVRVGFVGYR